MILLLLPPAGLGCDINNVQTIDIYARNLVVWPFLHPLFDAGREMCGLHGSQCRAVSKVCMCLVWCEGFLVVLSRSSSSGQQANKGTTPTDDIPAGAHQIREKLTVSVSQQGADVKIPHWKKPMAGRVHDGGDAG